MTTILMTRQKFSNVVSEKQEYLYEGSDIQYQGL